MNILDKISRIFEEDFWFEKEAKNHKNISSKSHIDEKVPAGYIDLILKNVSMDNIYKNHNTTLSYIKIESKYFVSHINIPNSNKSFDCYGDGENESITIFEENTKKLNLILRERDGSLEIRQIINGKLI